jgi:hypothetical protein
MVIGLIVVFFLPEIPLELRSAQQQRADEIASADAAAGPAAPPVSVSVASSGAPPGRA